MSTTNDCDDLHDDEEHDSLDSVADDLGNDLGLHDENEDVDEDEDDLCWSGVELHHFTERAMPHGRRAATWLLIGVLAELGAFLGGCFAANKVPADGLPSHVIVLFLSVVTIAIMLVILSVVHKRWERHRDCMESVIEEAMGWMGAAQREALRGGFNEQHYRDRIEKERVDALRAEMTWNVGPAPAFIDADDHEAIAAYEQRREIGPEFGDLFDALDDLDEREEPSDEGSSLAVRAWIERWARMKPVKQERLPRLEQRHSDAEGRRIERELCRAINKHWDGAFHRLLDEGADPNGVNGSGRPLRIAVLRGKVEYVSWLIAKGANPNGKCFGRTMLSILMSQVEDYIDEGDGEGDDFCWPEKLELLVRLGANPFIKNDWYDRDDDSEGPTAWPFITKRPVLYEAYQRGMAVRRQADDDTHRLLNDVRESAQLAEFTDTTTAMLDRFRNMRPA